MPVRGDVRKESINGFLSVSFGGVGKGRGYSLTISELKCSTFNGLSTLLLMCEEITLFPTPMKITCSDMTKSTHL